MVFRVHHGPAHADEVWACASLMAIGIQPEAIIRSNSHQDTQPGDYWVDCGREFDPDSRKFDHHQLSEAQSAFELVVLSHPQLRELRSENKAFDSLVNRISLQDTRGIAQVGEIVGNLDNVFGLIQAEFVLVRWFERDPQAACTLVAEYIRNMLDEVASVRQIKTDILAHIASNECVVQFGDVSVLDLTTFRPTYAIEPRAWTRAIGAVLASRGPGAPCIHCTVSLGSEGSQAPNQIALFRTKRGEEVLDFRRELKPEGVEQALIHFRHAAGYLCILKKDAQPWAWRAVVETAVIQRVSVNNHN